MKTLVKTSILGVEVTNASTIDILEYIVNCVEKKDKKLSIVTPNPEIVVFAKKNSDFKKILNNADLALNDGVGLGLAAKILGKSLKDRTTGVEMLEMLCKAVANRPITVGFLGAKGKVAELTADCLVKKYPGLKITFIAPEWGEGGFDLASKLQHDTEILGYKDINRKSPNIPVSKYPNIDILFVAYGFPKQEQFIADNIGKLPVQVMMGVGGSFDYISGQIPRAPQVLRSVGLEWLFRLLVQPWRWRRQLALVEFVWLVLKARISA